MGVKESNLETVNNKIFAEIKYGEMYYGLKH